MSYPNVGLSPLPGPKVIKDLNCGSEFSSSCTKNKNGFWSTATRQFSKPSVLVMELPPHTALNKSLNRAVEPILWLCAELAKFTFPTNLSAPGTSLVNW